MSATTVTADVRARPIVTDESIRAYAVEVGVCVRPLLRRLVDRETGDTTVVPLACGSTRERVCPTCSAAARRVRMQQCAEGWHLADEPPDPAPTTDDGRGDDGVQLDDDQDEVDEEDSARRTRSTRRRDDAADLPRLPVEDRTVGRTWTGNDGQTYRPSMFVTLTLDTYGRVDPTVGVPVDPGSYDYRRAALDALHFGRLFDRWVQNLRRCAGYKVQYFAAIEPQRRLAGHAHLAIRGAIPRATLRAVTRATYVQVWWPPHDTVAYEGDVLPVWDGTDYVDPMTRVPLPTWADALARLDVDPDAVPVHVARFGRQVDIKGLTGGTPDVDRSVRYLTKYLTKSIATTHAQVDEETGQPVEDPRMTAHVDRLHRELRWLPCSERCANWLRYGVQPKTPSPGLVPGRCAAPAHDRENAGLGGRRVLASRKWTGKTLTDHRADRAAVVREALTAAGIEAPDRDRCAASVVCEDGSARFVWEPVDRDRDGSVDYAAAILTAARQRHTWRQQYEQAKRHNDPGPAPPDGTCGQPFGNVNQAG